MEGNGKMKNIEMSWEHFEKLVRDHVPDREAADRITIDQETSLFRDLKYDSIAVVELLSVIEEEYGIDFTDLPNFMEKLDRCSDFYQGLQELLCR